MNTFRDALADVLPDYEVPNDDLVGEVLVPAIQTANEIRIGSGFFSSHCLAQIAPGLATFLTASEEPLQLLLSPEISAEDREAIERGTFEPEEVLRETVTRLFDEAELSPSAVVAHTLSCLSYLVAADRLQLRFVFMQAGMYHKKKWLLRCGEDWLGVHGSGNVTTRGLLVNGEQMTIDRAWCDGEAAATRVGRLVKQWERQWNNEHSHSLSVTAPQGLPFIARSSKMGTPTVSDFWDAWWHDYEAGLEPTLPPNVDTAPQSHRLRIPSWLNWQTGLFAHQSLAVSALRRHDSSGVLAIATGGGKTRTALVAATLKQDEHKGPVLVVVVVPSKPLMQQWAEEVREFSVEPVLPSRLSVGTKRSSEFETLRAGFATGSDRTEVLVVSKKLFLEGDFVTNLVNSLHEDVQTILIADEVHNLGVPTFLDEPPDYFDHRVGLSATPIRQYDPDGTDALFEFFGPQVFEFSLGEAIDAGCLCPYRYHLHEAPLTVEEIEIYEDLTEQLVRAGFRVDDEGQTVIPNKKVERLLRERRAVLEQTETKLNLLRETLREQGPSGVARTLIYVSAKKQMLGEKQLILVNRMLDSLGIVMHQFTHAETSRRDAQELLDSFGSGDFQVLTAMKVLDEGIDIPQTDTAFLLASSTVRREWIQRRGRILRKVPGKDSADLHDFLAVPPDPASPAGRSVLRGELARAEEFANLALNEYDAGGPRDVIDRIENTIWRN